MNKTDKHVSPGNAILLATILLNAVTMERGFTTNGSIYWSLVISVPLLAIVLFDRLQIKTAVTRNSSFVGRLRFLSKALRSEGNPNASTEQRPSRLTRMRRQF